MLRKLGFLFSSLQAASSVLLLATSALLISSAAEHPPVMLLMTMVVLVRAFVIGRAAFRYGERLALHDHAFRKLANLRVAVYKKLAPLAPIGLTRFGRGDLVSRMVEDVDEMQNLDLRVLPAVVQSVAATLLALGLTAVILPGYTIVLLLCLAVSIAAAIVATYFSVVKSQAQVAANRSELYDTMVDASERAKLFLAYGWASDIESRLRQQTLKLAAIERKTARATGLGAAILVLGLAIIQALGAWFAETAVVGGTLNRVLLAAFILVPAAIFEFYQMAVPAVVAFIRYTKSRVRIAEVLQVELPANLATARLETFESLEISSAFVTYPNGSVVHVPDFQLQPGETLAVVGPSGSGKSSMAAALVGFAASNGIEINGQPLEAFTETSLREVVGLTAQRPDILMGTVAANLRIANPVATDEQLRGILERVGLWTMLNKREGLETEVGQDAAFVSGGEASRLAFARLLLGERQIVMLDEPTAALDRELGFRIVEEFLEQSAGKTVILITHDPELAALCQRQIRFNQSA